jgi:hypothetical protein
LTKKLEKDLSTIGKKTAGEAESECSPSDGRSDEAASCHAIRRKNGERCRLATKKNETIGGGDMSKATDYTPEEWKVISSAPMMAGLLVSLSDMSGPIGLAKEAMAVVKAVNDTASGTTAELIKSVADEIRSQGGRSDLSEIRSDPANARAALIDRCKQAVALVEQKSPAEAQDYKRWLLSMAHSTAAASKEGGFLGFGGTVVSETETAAVRDLALALGMKEH